MTLETRIALFLMGGGHLGIERADRLIQPIATQLEADHYGEWHLRD